MLWLSTPEVTCFTFPRWPIGKLNGSGRVKLSVFKILPRNYIPISMIIMIIIILNIPARAKHVVAKRCTQTTHRSNLVDRVYLDRMATGFKRWRHTPLSANNAVYTGCEDAHTRLAVFSSPPLCLLAGLAGWAGLDWAGCTFESGVLVSWCLMVGWVDG